ncbi:ABC-F family ATP-binding cassette domain-containing protein [Marinilabilia salmonicolor]|jgi:ATP-binding cassette subfamily F protein 3|uniref:Probable ATP-binding protein YbiT n=1 Tax=Marinilabilia salmonicolor TaxID=989 RepID=A0A2T0XH19_9BACT|nr:ABC-F family ATP-binding cassette domain-containing protein [Marinilabilia salmonicolor]PRY98248.1 ATP-binding cassette subfamily F protein 3 [Marinilabilia salmonicolor]RCW29212.1 ATP-binding cassette subfamily F protein 3 [Marinilabilia salmonicolor]
MVSVNQLTLDFGTFLLFEDVSFLINPRDRIGLVGKNGAGKTTLLKVITGAQEPTSGEVTMPRDFSVGYLPQVMKHDDRFSVFEETEQAFSEIKKLEKQIEELTQAIHHREDYHSEEYLSLIDKLTEANERFNMFGGHDYRSRIEVTLKGLGFKPSDFERPTSEFSGGWRMRIELAKILLRKPDLFLLDEPTNHLDIESITWLEDFLKNYSGAVVLISHDKAFLDNVTTRTIEISLGRIYDYKASYSQFVTLRHERREQQLAAYRNQQKKIEDTEQFIERFRYKATKAVQVQSRIKQLEKMDRIEVDEFDNSKLNIKFPPAPHSGKLTVSGKHVSKSYGDLLVLDDIDFDIERGEKVAFVGKNGEGKTTLARIIMQELQHEGTVKLGHQVKIGYFAQNQAERLDENLTVFETVDKVATGDIRTKVRDLLGAFLFSGEEVDKKVSVLSGGERTRLAMVMLLLEPVNFLVLDEPTNHLDMRSKDILKQALNDFEGSVLVVSHDREFLDGLVDRIFEFTNKKTKVHLGGIYEFLRKKKMDTLQELERVPLKANKTDSEVSGASSGQSGKVAFAERKELNKRIKKAENEVSKSEEDIARLEKELEGLSAVMENPEKASDPAVFEMYQKIQKNLDAAMEEWEVAHLELEELQQKRNVLDESA